MGYWANDIPLSGFTSSNSNGFVLYGAVGYDQSGTSVSGGDVNGDGFSDIIVGSPSNSEFAQQGGSGYVQFGHGSTPAFSAVDLASFVPGAGTGFKYSAATDYTQLGLTVSALGDINGDGVKDFALGAPYATSSQRQSNGAVYVIYGKRTNVTFTQPTLLASTTGTLGFRIYGETAYDQIGLAVSPAGDFNKDGRADFMVAAPPKTVTGTNGISGGGVVYLIFGKATANAADIDLTPANFPSSSTNGIRITGGTAGYNYVGVGTSVAAAGDVNQDGYDDIIIGAPSSTYAGRANCGAAAVIFGHGTGVAFSDINIAALPSSVGFLLFGAYTNDNLGWSVSSVKNLNGDIYPDLIIGAPNTAGSGGTSTGGSVFVYYGRATSTNVDLFSPGSIGSFFKGLPVYSQLGARVAGLGDVNGDGFDDFAVAAPHQTVSALTDTGVVYVIYGKATMYLSPQDLSTFTGGAAGYKIIGSTGGALLGTSLSRAGDVNGDGLMDIVIGASGVAYLSRSEAGATYVIFGVFTSPPPPTVAPSALPISTPTVSPTTVTPTKAPVAQPTLSPTANPSAIPSATPSAVPSVNPSVNPTANPTVIPTAPSANPTFAPSANPTMIPTAPSANPSLNPTATPTVVPPLFGPNDIDLAWLSKSRGYRMLGATANDFLGTRVGRLKDISGDGVDELVVTGSRASIDSLSSSGVAYVFYGNATRHSVNDVDLLNFQSGPAGFRIRGAVGEQVGYAVASVRGFFGDASKNEFALTATANSATGVDAGAVYVLPAKLYTADVDLSTASALRIYGPAGSALLGTGVDTAGDFNGDNVNDMIIGATGVTYNGRTNCGAAYVLFGKVRSAPYGNITLSNFVSGPSTGIRIFGAVAQDNLGFQIGRAFDVNGDSFDDIYISSVASSSLKGVVYIIFGHPSPYTDVDLLNFNSGLGYRILGAKALDRLGFSVSVAGDINGDGRSDLIIAASTATGTISTQGIVYVLYGPVPVNGLPDINLANFTAGAMGFRVFGQSITAKLTAVSNAGDVNGDGVPDVVISANSAGVYDRTLAGVAYVIYGKRGAVSDIYLNATLPITSGFRILGEVAQSRLGAAVAFAGDVNNDGYGDILISAALSNAVTGRVQSGTTYVVYGFSTTPSAAPTTAPTFTTTDIDVTNFVSNQAGVKMLGASSGDYAGFAVNCAGDINGDGVDDVLVGAPYAHCAGIALCGVAYVVYGKRGRNFGEIDLQTANSTIVRRIYGTRNSDTLGLSLSPGGDVNGDGRKDFIVGGVYSGLNTTTAGITYVIFGQSYAQADLNLTSFTSGPYGFRIIGSTYNDYIGYSVGGGGDINGDGFSDLVVGVPFGDPLSRNDAGVVQVIFGRNFGFFDDVYLSTYKTSWRTGFRILGASAGVSLGTSVKIVGDVNGDGLADIAIATKNTVSYKGRKDAGRVYVIFGTSSAVLTDIDLTHFTSGAAGYNIFGAYNSSLLGGAVNAAGDVNSDGFADLIVTAPGAAASTTASATYVIYGQFTDFPFADVDLLTALGAGNNVGFMLYFPKPFAGLTANGVRDVNGDGYDDILIGNPNSAIASRASTGYAYLIYGTASASRPSIDLNAPLPSSTGTRFLGYAGLLGRFGGSVSSAGDFNQDGVSDILFGASRESPVVNSVARNFAGAAYVYFGTKSPMYVPTRAPSVGVSQSYTSVPSVVPTVYPSPGPTTALPTLQTDSAVDLTTISVTPELGLVYFGANAKEYSGRGASFAGDLNGDGRPDMLIAAPGASYLGRLYCGVVYVVFSNNTRQHSQDLSNFVTGPTTGYRILGANRNDQIGIKVSTAGDFNGDGQSDIMIKSEGTTGAVYILFSRPAGSAVQDVDLRSFVSGVDGIRLLDSAGGGGTSLGCDFKPAGDVNGDGISDVIVGATMAFNHGADTGSAYVFFGTRNATLLRDIVIGNFTSGVRGFRILGAAKGDRLGNSVSGAGDVNGDGIADVVVGAYLADKDGRPKWGAAYVVFGRSHSLPFTDINTSLTNSTAFSKFASAGGSLGGAVSGAGDVNGDGIDDLIISSPTYIARGGTATGMVYVFFGRRSFLRKFDFTRFVSGVDGFKVNSNSASQQLGWSVSKAGDVNKDGFADIIISGNSGSLYVLYGHSGTLASFNDINTLGFASGNMGYEVFGNANTAVASAAGDINGDGVDDLLIADSQASPMGRDEAGSTYVLFGRRVTAAPTALPTAQPTVAPTPVPTATPTAPPSSISPTISPTIQSTASPTRSPSTLSTVPPSVLSTAQPSYAASAVKLSTIPANPALGYEIMSALAGDLGGQSSAVADVNGDNVKDIIFGVEDGDIQNAGCVYVIFSSHSTNNLRDLSAFTTGPTTGYRILGAVANDYIGRYVASIGDFNGDGMGDFAVSSRALGGVYVFFSSHTVQDIHLSSFNFTSGVSGFRIYGQPFDGIGTSVACAGDVNSDGLDDFVVGAPSTSYQGRSHVGAAYVIFGQRQIALMRDIDLRGGTFVTGLRGFSVIGNYAGGQLGVAVSSAGDVNGDGVSDVILGAYQANPAGRSSAGAVYVVLGRNASTPFKTINLFETSADITISGADDGGVAGYAVGSAGDFNGDGVSDMLIGAIIANNEDGCVYLIFGARTTIPHRTLDLESFTSGPAGVRIFGYGGVMLGGVVKSVGDVNGDGYSDIFVLVGSSGSPSYVLYGHSAVTPFTDIYMGTFQSGSLGFEIVAFTAITSASALGDIDGDGVDDVLVCDAGASPLGRSYAGSAFVIYGRTIFSHMLSPSALPTTFVPTAIPSSRVPTTAPSIRTGDRVMPLRTSGASGLTITGGGAGSGAGQSVSNAGDVNGDKYDDVIIGVPWMSVFGVAVVVYGGKFGVSTAEISLANFTSGAKGFKIVGYTGSSVDGSTTGYAVSSAGDVNGDGLADVIVGAPQFRRPGRVNVGAAFVIFGSKASRSTDVLLQFLTPVQGFKIVGISSLAQLGVSVGAAGDVNGDGYGDVLVGALGLNQNRGAAYVLFSQFNGSHFVDIDMLLFIPGPTAGSLIIGHDVNHRLGTSLSGVGDVNNDGVPDLVVGAPYYQTSFGAAYVLFGNRNGSYIPDPDLLASTGQGFAVHSTTSGSYFGYSVSIAGDVSGDGIDDWIGGAFGIDSAFVMFGKPRSSVCQDIFINSSVDPSLAYVLKGDYTRGKSNFGLSVSGTSDLNGDGVRDIIVGANVINAYSVGSGAAYVFYGSASGDFKQVSAFNLNPSSGFAVFGAAEGDAFGNAVCGAGDVNGDGLGDIIIGASTALLEAGEAYVIYGVSSPSSHPTAHPTALHTTSPSAVSSIAPSLSPSANPTPDPTVQSSAGPTHSPTVGPTLAPSHGDTASPSTDPSVGSTFTPTVEPTNLPTVLDAPTVGPTAAPSAAPTNQPSTVPTASPSVESTFAPTVEPTVDPTVSPSRAPTDLPTVLDAPTAIPTAGPTAPPSTEPTIRPTVVPSVAPTTQPTVFDAPSAVPTASPSADPSTTPTLLPTVASAPSVVPTVHPSAKPSRMPSKFPTVRPTILPSRTPSAQPSVTSTVVVTDPHVIVAVNITPIFVVRSKTSLSVQVSLTSNAAMTVYCAARLLSKGPVLSAGDITNDGHFATASAFSTVVMVSGLFPASSYRIFCIGVSALGVTTSIARAQQSALVSSTDCCKTLDVKLLQPSVSVGNFVASAVSVSFDAAPSSTLNVAFTLTATNASASDASFAAAVTYPSALSLRNTTSTSTSTVALSAGTSGTQVLRVSLTGASAAEYTVVYQTSTTLTVGASGQPGVPVPQSAQFSNDGSSVVVIFDVPTNKAGNTNEFKCSALLAFPGSSSATCQWADASSITIYPQYTTTGSSSILVIGSTVTVKASKIKASCASTTAAACATWSFVSATSLIVAAPVSAVLPVVTITSPSQIGDCNSLTIDLTNTVGSAGRPWVGPTFTVTTSDTSASAAAVAILSFLTKNYTMSPPTAIPAKYIQTGATYTISAKLCNFLGACDSEVTTVNVRASDGAVPIVSIPGPAQRSVYRSAGLVLSSSAYTQACSGVASYSNLDLTWSVTSPSGASTIGVVSSSVNPAAYKLNPYALQVGGQYKITLTGRSSLSAISSSTSVLVTVLQGNLVAKLAGGSSRSIRAGDIAVFDASSSFDEDVQTKTGAAAGLTFQWACVQTSPTFSTVCPLVLPSNLNTAIINVDATAQSLNTTSTVSVEVSDATRSSTAQVTVTVSTALLPVLTLTSTLASLSNVNTAKSLVLLGYVQLYSSCAAQWTVDDETLQLSSISTTPVTATLQPSGRSVAFNLALSAGALPGRSTLVFTLTCGSVSNSLTVTTNGAPLPGTFAVSPAVGVELSTVFQFVATQWTDSDLPLTYQFGFQSVTSVSNLVVVSRSELSFSASTLPAGPLEKANAVQCNLQVYDNLAATSNTTTAAVVTPLSKSEQEANLLSLVQSSTGSVDSIKNIISVVSASLNSVNCTSAPDCATLNRDSCLKTSATCSACLDGYIGDAGDRNTQCISYSSQTDVSCSVPSDCLSWQVCDSDSLVCVAPQKTCANICTNHGECIFVNKITSDVQTSCRLDNLNCDAVCSCSGDYSGVSCEINVGDLQTRRQLRSSLIDGLFNLTDLEDPSEQSVSAWAASLYSLSLNPYELSVNDAKQVLRIANRTVVHSAEFDLDSGAEIVGVLQATDTVFSVQKYNYNPNDFSAINASRTYQNNTAVGIIEVVGAFANLLSKSKVLGQNSSAYFYDNFRVSSQLQSFHSNAANLSISIPQSDFERLTHTAVASVKLAPNAVSTSTASVAVSVISVYPSAYTPDTSAFESSPLYLQITSDSGEAPSSVVSNMEFTFPFNDAHPSFVEPATNFTFFCFNVRQNYTFTCPDTGHILYSNCSAGRGEHVKFCPTRTPTCARLDISTATVSPIDSCRVVSYTADSVTCSCAVESNVTVTERRNLYTFETSLLDETGVSSMLATSVVILNEFADTFNAAPDLTNPEDVIIVILMFATLWGAGVLLLSVCFWRDHVSLRKKVRMLSRQVVGVVTSLEGGTSIDDAKVRLLNYIENIIPSVYAGSKTSFHRMVGELRSHHRYLSLFTLGDGQISNLSKILIIVQVLTVETMQMFLLAVMYDLQEPDDDHSCPTFTNEGDCTARKSIFDDSQTYCQWSYDAKTMETGCSFHNIRFTAKIFIYILILTSVFTALVNSPLDYFFKICAAPLIEDAMDEQVANLDASGKKRRFSIANGLRRVSAVTGKLASNAHRRTSAVLTNTQHFVKERFWYSSIVDSVKGNERVIADRDIPEDVQHMHKSAVQSLPSITKHSDYLQEKRRHLSEELKQKADLRRSRGASMKLEMQPDFLDEATQVVLATPVSPIPTAIAEAGGSMAGTMKRLTDEVLCQRLLLPLQSYHAEIYDAQWGIVAGEKDDNFSISEEAHAAIEEDVHAAETEARELNEKLPLYTLHHGGLAILNMFLLDLLGKRTIAAKIFRNKFEEDFEETRAVSRPFKAFAIAVLVISNAFFIYYSLLKALQKGHSWQYQYLQGCIAQMAVEIFLNETLECLWLNYVVPDLARKEVNRVTMILNHVVDQITSKVDTFKSNSVLFLDAPSYLFASTKVAKAHPALIESIVVMNFHSHLPGELSRTWPHYKKYATEKLQDEMLVDADAALVGSSGFKFTNNFFFRAILAVGVYVTLSMQLLGSLSFNLQRIVIRVIQPLLLSGFTLLWLFASSSSIALIITFSCTGAFALAFIWRQRYLHIEEVRRNSLVAPSLEDDVEGDDTDEDEMGPGSMLHLAQGSFISKSSQRSDGDSSGHKRHVGLRSRNNSSDSEAMSVEDGLHKTFSHKETIQKKFADKIRHNLLSMMSSSASNSEDSDSRLTSASSGAHSIDLSRSSLDDSKKAASSDHNESAGLALYRQLKAEQDAQDTAEREAQIQAGFSPRQSMKVRLSTKSASRKQSAADMAAGADHSRSGSSSSGFEFDISDLYDDMDSGECSDDIEAASPRRSPKHSKGRSPKHSPKQVHQKSVAVSQAIALPPVRLSAAAKASTPAWFPVPAAASVSPTGRKSDTPAASHKSTTKDHAAESSTPTAHVPVSVVPAHRHLTRAVQSVPSEDLSEEPHNAEGSGDEGLAMASSLFDDLGLDDSRSLASQSNHFDDGSHSSDGDSAFSLDILPPSYAVSPATPVQRKGKGVKKNK